jgi:hypothetical protein
MKVNLKKLPQVLDVVLILASLVALYPFLSYHLQLIYYPKPLEMREAGMLMTTWAINHGINPLSADNMPQYLNVYGILYNILSLPFSWVIGNQLIAHKLSTAVFLFASCVLIYLVVFKQSTQKALAIIAAISMYACLLVLVIPLPRPETLGTFLFLFCLYFPLIRGFSDQSLHWAYGVGIAAALAKVYFIFCLPILSLYLFLFVSKQKALRFSLIYACIALVFYGLLFLIFPLYWMNTLCINIGCTYPVIPHWRYFQLAVLRLNVFPIALWVLGFGLLYWLGVNFKKWFKLPQVRSYKDYGVFTYRDPYLFYLVVCFGLFYFKMANNYGAFVYYALEMVAPHFILFIIFLIHRQWILIKVCSVGLLLYNLTYVYAYILNDRGFAGNSGTPESWAQLEQLIEEHKNVFASPVVAPLLLEKDREVFDSGLTEWYEPCNTMSNMIFTGIIERNTNYKLRMLEQVKTQSFDLIILDMYGSWLVSPDQLQTYYQRNETIVVNLPHTGQNYTLVVWRPSK